MPLGFPQLALLYRRLTRLNPRFGLNALCLLMAKPLCKQACAELLSSAAAWLNSFLLLLLQLAHEPWDELLFAGNDARKQQARAITFHGKGGSGRLGGIVAVA